MPSSKPGLCARLTALLAKWSINTACAQQVQQRLAQLSVLLWPLIPDARRSRCVAAAQVLDSAAMPRATASALLQAFRVQEHTLCYPITCLLFNTCNTGSLSGPQLHAAWRPQARADCCACERRQGKPALPPPAWTG